MILSSHLFVYKKMHLNHEALTYRLVTINAREIPHAQQYPSHIKNI